jgi:hypothetical protein
MKSIPVTRLGRLLLATGLAAISVTLMMAAALMMGGPVAVAADGTVDFTVEAQAPAHVASDASFLVRIAYYNYGTSLPPDAWVTATVPAGTEVVATTDRWGTPLPPDVTDGPTLGWYFESPACHWPLDANCGHVLITLQPDKHLAEGTLLTTTVAVATSAVESDTTNNEGSVTSELNDMAGSSKQLQARGTMPGDVLTYTIQVALQSGAGHARRWVALTDTLPFSHQVRFLGWRGTLTSTQIDGQTLRWQGWVTAGQALTVQYRLGIEGVVTPGTVITNVAQLGWAGHRMQLGPVTTVVTLPHGALALGPFQGGQLEHAHGVSLTIPPGVVSDTTRFQCGPLYTDTLPTDPPGGLLYAHRAFGMNAFRFGEPVRQFSWPLTITLRYADTDVAGLKRETLRLWTRTGPEGPWAALGTAAGVTSGTLVFTTTHLSEFALFGEASYRTVLPFVTR